MQQRGKKPPISLEQLRREEEDKRGEHQPGSLDYVGSVKERSSRGNGDNDSRDYEDSPEGINWKQVLTAAVIALMASVIVMLGYAASNGSLEKFSIVMETLDAKVDTVQGNLDESVMDLQEKIDSAVLEARSAKNALSDYAKKGDIPVAPDLGAYAKKTELPDVSVYAKKTELPDVSGYANKSTLEDLVKRVGDLESDFEGMQGSSSSSGGEYIITDITRWTTSVKFASGLIAAHADLRVDISPSRVGPEEDFYELELEFYNAGTTDIINANPKLSVILTPRDYVYVDEYAPLLATLDWPYVEWDTDVSTRIRGGQEICQRITFESDVFDELKDLAPGETVRYNLEVELFYN